MPKPCHQTQRSVDATVPLIGNALVNHGNRFVNHANRFVNHANRCVNHANRCVNHANRFVNHGIRFVNHGIRFVNHGMRFVNLGNRFVTGIVLLTDPVVIARTLAKIDGTTLSSGGNGLPPSEPRLVQGL